jgi:hypothetical protein
MPPYEDRMSKPKRPKRRRNRRPSNITVERTYDPFPKSGLVKQNEPFIRKRVHEFCRQNPGLNRQQVLFRAVEIAIGAESAYKPERGSFATYLIWRLKELHRLYDEDDRGTPIHCAKGELAQDKAEERGEKVELNFSGGNNGARLKFDLQWWLPRLGSAIVNCIGSLGALGDLIPTLALRHRVKAGIQLGSDNAPTINERISADLPEVVRQQPIGETLKGWVRAIFDNAIRRQREADDEAQKRAVGDHSPTFLEADQHAVEVRFPGARRPPKYLPTHVPLASLDTPIGETGEGSAPRSLHEIVGEDAKLADVVIGDGVDKQVDTMRWALEEVRPSLSKNEQLVADEMLRRLEGHRSRGLAGLGISKGYASKLWHGVAGKVADKIRGRK